MPRYHAAFRALVESRRVDLDVEQVKTLFDSGMGQREIARHLGCGRGPVRRICNAHGFLRPARTMLGKNAGDKNPSWNGGLMHTRGRIYVLTDGRYRSREFCDMQKCAKAPTPLLAVLAVCYEVYGK